MEKRHLKRGLVIFTMGLLLCTVAVLGYITYSEYNRAQAYKRYAEARSQSSFNELVTSMSEISSSLEKSLYCTTPSLTSAVCTQVFGKAMAAQMSLGELPFSTIELEQTASFISHVGDYVFALARSAPKGGGYSGEERKNLNSLSETASRLSENLRSLQEEMNKGGLTMDDLYEAERKMDDMEEREGVQDDPATAGSAFRLIEQEFPEVPSLIYDGPFSDHIASLTPRLLEGEKNISENAARRIIAEFLGIQEGRVFISDKIEGDLPAYRFSASLESGDVNVAITRKGGKIISVMNEGNPTEAKLSAEEAKERAALFLESRGYTGMRESYHVISGNSCTVNYAYTQDEVICYADLVKVKVALDDGSIIGLEAKGYIMSHCERQMPLAEIDAETAKEQITGDLSPISEGMALIPTGGKYEMLCHEFICEAQNGRHLIVYVNAVSGEQEKILILLEDESGTLAI